MKEIVRYILETVVCSGILYGAYLLFLRNCTGYLAARLCLTGSLLAAALIPLLRIPVWPGKVIYATAGTPAKTTFTAPSVSAAAFDYERRVTHESRVLIVDRVAGRVYADGHQRALEAA